jgi:hypothetical protein
MNGNIQRQVMSHRVWEASGWDAVVAIGLAHVRASFNRASLPPFTMSINNVFLVLAICSMSLRPVPSLVYTPKGFKNCAHTLVFVVLNAL